MDFKYWAGLLTEKFYYFCSATASLGGSPPLSKLLSLRLDLLDAFDPGARSVVALP